MITISFRKDKREEKIKYNFTIINRVPRNVGYKPVPELGQTSKNMKKR